MRYIALTLGLLFVSGSALTPLEAASKARTAKPHATRAKKSKVKARKASKPAKSHARAN